MTCDLLARNLPYAGTHRIPVWYKAIHEWLIFMGKLVGKWVFPKIGVPENGWFVMKNPIKMDDLGVPLFLETAKYTKVPWILWRILFLH